MVVQNTEDRILYFCIGCRQIHWDNDYNKSDGDVAVLSWKKLLESIEDIKKIDSYNLNKAKEDVE